VQPKEGHGGQIMLGKDESAGRSAYRSV